MSRLTEKVNYGSSWVEDGIETDNYIPKSQFDSTTGKCIDKLGKLEDLEEQLGCPLEVYVTATRSGIYYSIAGVMKHCYVDVIDANKIIFAMKGTNIWFELKNYKKTWWLKKDRSE